MNIIKLIFLTILFTISCTSKYTEIITIYKCQNGIHEEIDFKLSKKKSKVGFVNTQKLLSSIYENKPFQNHISGIKYNDYIGFTSSIIIFKIQNKTIKWGNPPSIDSITNQDMHLDFEFFNILKQNLINSDFSKLNPSVNYNIGIFFFYNVLEANIEIEVVEVSNDKYYHIKYDKLNVPKIERPHPPILKIED